MRVLLIFSGLLFLLSSTVKAQNTEFELLNTNNGIVPYQRYVDFPFQFLVKDEVQSVLTNPSRLNTISERKIFTTLQDNDPDRRFLYVNPNKWLIRGLVYVQNSKTVSNEGNFSTTYDNSLSSNILQSSSRTVNIRRDDTRDVEKKIGDLEFQRLFRSKENNGIAVGFRLAVEQTMSDELYILKSDEFKQSTTTTNGVLNSENEEVAQRDMENESKNNRNRFLAQFILSGYNETWNWVQSLNVQFGEIDLEETILSTYDLVETDRDGSEMIIQQNNNNSIQNSDVSTKVTPLLLGYNGTFTKEINWLGADYIIGSFQFNHAFGEVDVTNISRDTHTTRNLLTDELEVSRLKNSTAELSNEKEFMTDLRFSTGYAIEKASNGLHIFTGLLPQFSYVKTQDHYYNRYLGISKVVESMYTIDLQLPIVAELELNKWVSVFGGGSMSTLFSMRDLNRSTLIPSIFEEEAEFDTGRTLDDSSVRSGEFDSEYDQLRFSQFTFLGLKAQHSSGIQLYADISTELKSVIYWKFSIGYHF